ncbi:serine protease inhibitor 77Ba-like [Cydia splendana]|uniref:serine protease inhibitor 77Ba-like n=1 Tax=Cydia splendana TaxID=1100963 RepID=UPI0021464BA5
MFIVILELCACFVLCLGQNKVKDPQYKMNLTKFSDSTGNFSIELLYHVAEQQEDQNFVLSPFAAWTMLAVTSEGALGKTRQELLSALRFDRNSPRTTVRYYYQEIARWLVVNRTTAQFTKFNGIFMDRDEWQGIEDSFRQIAEKIYNTDAVNLNFKNNAAASTINRAVSLTTEDRIPTLIDESHLNNTHLLITSAVYFKGQWTSPFNDATVKRDFFNSIGEKIGEVNMMYNRHTYPFANISELQASVIELPYGVENHMSMILMLPNPDITLEDMFLNFLKANLKTVFQELRVSQEERGDVEIDCFIPRYKIVSNFELNEILKYGMGIYDLFDPKKVVLGRLARRPIRDTKVVHKTEIDVTEESTTGTTSSVNTAPEFANDSKVTTLEANRPFSFFIMEKHTNTIVLEGVYRKPILY